LTATVDNTPLHRPWDEDDEDLTDSDESVLDAFDEYVPTGEADDEADSWDPLCPPIDDEDDQVSTLLVTATNPPGTVSVTVLLDGRILR
jgi:hypothetical protein